ncbi:MAG TPA: alanine dehydrogenase [Syntrophorhabdaceae bacterium]|nr:alanine dehydrogenase [Syntrophorhabdaceae bacterium]
MVIGIPREIKEGENRVALTPAGAHILVLDGHRVIVERGAGAESGFADDEYAGEGAEIMPTGEHIFAAADLIVKVKEPLEQEWPLLREEQLVFTYLHLASSEKLMRALLEQKITGIAYETVVDRDGRLPLLVPMSEVAGRMSIQAAMRFLEAEYKGRGILLSGVPGVAPAEVVIIGCGIVGLNAAKMASGLGAHVTAFDISHDRLKYIDDILGCKVMTIYSTPYSIKKAVAYADVLIGAVLVTGAKAPIVVTQDMVYTMKPGSVIIDVSVDQGGCVETIRPTTFRQPIYTLNGIIHCGITNIPAAVPRTSTVALTNATLPYIRTIALKGIKKAAADDRYLAEGINCAKGVLTYAAVAEAFKIDWRPWNEVLS